MLNVYHIHDKILAANPIPHNVKGIQKLDECIKELLSNNKKLSTLNQEKTLKGTQEKAASILGPLTRLWNIMEAERKHFQIMMTRQLQVTWILQLFLNKAFYL